LTKDGTEGTIGDNFIPDKFVYSGVVAINLGI